MSEQAPLLPMIIFMFWVYYGLALFWGNRDKVGEFALQGDVFSAGSLTAAMMLALFGVTMFWVGMKMRLGHMWVPKRLPDIDDNTRKWSYLRAVLVIGLVLSFFEQLPVAFGEGGRQVVYTFQAAIPMAAYAILLTAHFRGESQRIDKLLLIAFFLTRSVTGLSSIWLGSLAWLIAISAVVYIRERRRIPYFTIITIVLCVLFFQPGKGAVRGRYWYGDTEGTKVERIGYWIEESSTRWKEALSEPETGAVKDLSSQSLMRLSLLTQTANVVELTPSVVPYQYFHLYSYIPKSLVPRLVWPNKPSVNEANQFYQVAYGLTPEERLGNVAIAVGFLTESYISFGWIGVAVFMFCLGVLISFFQNVFFDRKAGILLNGIGIVLLPRLLGIESQTAVYLSGIVQQVLLTLLVFAPIIRFRNVSRNI